MLILLSPVASQATGIASDPRPPSEPIVITPHRALYKMTLYSQKNGSNIADVSGKMYFEWADACDGWAVQQHLKLHFAYSEGEESDVNSTVISWESKDGKKYNFNVRRVTNGKETENYRGHASLDEHGGRGLYTIPKDKKEVKLGADALFPSAHTLLILQKAAAGEKFFTRRVFDGSDEEGAADVSVFIGGRLDQPLASEKNPAMNDNPLIMKEAWPVRLAFFKPTSETGEPDYEMDMTLQPNGVARTMHIDYGDFSVSGVLTNLETLPASNCNAPKDQSE
jgi:hypothetical protein